MLLSNQHIKVHDGDCRGFIVLVTKMDQLCHWSTDRNNGTIPDGIHVDKNVKKLEPSYIPGGNGK